LAGGLRPTASCSSARHAKRLALGAIDLLQIRIVAHAFEAFLQRNDFVVAGHHDDGAELCAAFSGVGLN
jgi:hypothetical protein